MTDRFAPPSHLSHESKELWCDLVPRKARSAGRLALLVSALEARDRAEQARLELARGTLTTTTKTTGAIHVNPLVKVEREARQQFARIWEQLHFGYDMEDGIDFERWQAKQELIA